MTKYLIYYTPYEAWYRPDASGYTDSVMEAGRFSGTNVEAKGHMERMGCVLVEDGSEEMQKLCNKWERYFIPKLKEALLEAENWKQAAGDLGRQAMEKDTAQRLTAERDALQAKIDEIKQAYADFQQAHGITLEDSSDKAGTIGGLIAERDAAVAAKERAVEALREFYALANDKCPSLWYSYTGKTVHAMILEVLEVAEAGHAPAKGRDDE